MTERDQVRANIKRRLNSYRDLVTEHAQLTEELKRVETLMSSPTGSALDGMPRSGSGPSNPVERIAIKHMAQRGGVTESDGGGQSSTPFNTI